jgi:hypothetical protein
MRVILTFQRIHEREASQRWDRQLGQGDPLNQVSTHTPKGRGPFFNHPTDPPGQDAFYRGAVDALTNCPPQLPDGSTTFTIPDLNGQFLRGIDNGNGTDINRSFGAGQLDAFKSHTHTERFNDSGFAASSTTASSPPTRMEVNISNTQYQTSATGDVETRPVNQTVLYVIRYQ